MTERLPALVTAPASEAAFWTTRLRQWLLEQSELTQRNYSSDLKDFATWAGFETVPGALSVLFSGEHQHVALRVQDAALGYIENLRTRPVYASHAARAAAAEPTRHGLAPATIQRRIVALRAAVGLAVQAGLCPRDVELPKVRKVKTLRDTRGIDRMRFLQLLDTLDHAIDTAKAGSQKHDLAVRDMAIFRLLHDVGLRQVEVRRICIEHLVEPDGPKTSVWLQRKGDDATERQLWPVASLPAQAIRDWLAVRKNPTYGPLFTTRTAKPLAARSLRSMVVELKKK